MRVPRLSHRLPDPRRTPTPHRLEKDPPKGGPEQTVDDEVTGRVDDDEEVAELRVVEVEAATVPVLVAERRPEDLVEQGGRLTDDEYADDGDDAVRDVVLLVASTR